MEELEFNVSEDIKRLNPQVFKQESTRQNKILFGESESDFATWVDSYAHFKGWLVAGFRPARVMRNGKETWETPVLGDGKDFPDRVFARAGRVILAELKSESGKLRPGQLKWLTASGGLLWRPSMRDKIMEILE